jgi:hypothetical protein
VEAEIEKVKTKGLHNPHNVLASIDLATDKVPNRDFTIGNIYSPSLLADIRLRAIFDRHVKNSESRLVEASFIAGQDHARLIVSLRLKGVEDGVPQYDIINSYVRYYRPG